jgi:DNA-binding CsgD family transcriptional regulator
MPDDKRQVTAEERANALLRHLLGEDDFAQLVRVGYVDVVSPSNPTRHYRVPRGRSRVGVYQDGLQIASLCVGPVEFLPTDDLVALHVCLIRGNEAAYCRTANWMRMADPRVPRPVAPEWGDRAHPFAGIAEQARLTTREREVLALLLQGLRTSDIAARLVITRSTAAGHIQHILAKLGVHSRAEAYLVARYRQQAE